MFIDTTLHLQSATVWKISKAARLAGRSGSHLISRLLNIMAGEKTAPPVSWSRIRYQQRNSSINWHRMHVSLSPVEYELLLDLRKVYKMSGSHIIALAVDKYMDRLQGDVKNADNYRLSCYVFSRFILDGVICWAQYWGLPGRLHSFPDLPLAVRNHVPLQGG
ncbi:MAG TPA: hypothetical protein PLM53_16285 [Spirochaetota bacterium]|nr:hypothetical protein [Spirochaetota bacterium]HPC42245.1 hypothetical protein [Spirochaetota bacterium]HPL18845.1 hypothetical protein [Spirochaetota bacterium]HQF09950.1 hypothetical protein [Spirochaetota bacterium]HQH98655.1 hypothetical protein [Spirochaetota bacterium]